MSPARQSHIRAESVQTLLHGGYHSQQDSCAQYMAYPQYLTLSLQNDPLQSNGINVQEACKLYCLCQLPYNEERPMLSCDYCQEWFHYDCVGLRAPSDDEDDEDVAPKDYRCPDCCRKVF